MTTKKLITFFTFCLLGIPPLNAQLKKNFTIEDFKCCWQIKGMVYEQNGGMYSNEAAKKLTDKKICFNRDTLDILGDTIIQVKFSITRESTRTFIASEFQVYQDIDKWFKITADSMYVIKLNGRGFYDGIVQSSSENRRLAYDGKYLYLPDNGAFFTLTKCLPEIKKYVGTGSTVKQFALSGKEKSLNMFYEFYTDSDEIIVYDQNGKELYHSEMVSTKQEKSANIKLDNTTKFTVKIISKNTDSRWAFWFDTK